MDFRSADQQCLVDRRSFRPSRREANDLAVFVNYNLKKGWYLSSSPVVSANWQAASGNVWTVPVGGGVGRVFRLGFQPVNVAAQFYSNAAHPRNGSSWSMRLQIAFLFPKLPPAMKERLKALQQQK